MMIAVPVQVAAAFSFGKPVPLFAAGAYQFNVVRDYDVSRDGTKFLMVKNASNATAPKPSFIVVTHWLDEVRAKLAAK